MGPIVLDASVTLSWCFDDEASDYSERVLDFVCRNEGAVPGLWALEISNVLLQAEKAGRIDEHDSLEFLELLSKLPIRSMNFSIVECLGDIYPLAQKEKLTTYDATYLRLAQIRKCRLATLDDKLKKTAKRLGISTEVQ